MNRFKFPDIPFPSWDIQAIIQTHNEIMPEAAPALQEVHSMLHYPFLKECKGYALDVGCGNAEVVLSLIQDGVISKGLAIDFCPQMIENARQTAQHLHISQKVEFRCLPFEDLVSEPIFDTVIMWDVLEHFYSSWDAIKKASQLLKPSGVLVGTVPVGKSIINACHLHYFSKDDLFELFGLFPVFKDVQVTTMPGVKDRLYFKGNL
jgi:2-polyprenyl-3-methyl-5-hydroxy-6-metoxy-1,4-benzoquinol methylase